MNHYVRVSYRVPAYIDVLDAMDMIEDFVYSHLQEFGCLPRDDMVKDHIFSIFDDDFGDTTKLHLMIQLTDEEAVATAADRSEYKHPECEKMKQKEKKVLRKMCKRKRLDSDATPCKVLKQTKCNICLEEIDARRNVTLPCEHQFHYACIKKWLGYKKVCPTCHVPVKLDTN